MKKDDRLLVSSAFRACIRPETFLKVSRTELSPTYNSKQAGDTVSVTRQTRHLALLLFNDVGRVSFCDQKFHNTLYPMINFGKFRQNEAIFPVVLQILVLIYHSMVKIKLSLVQYIRFLTYSLASAETISDALLDLVIQHCIVFQI